MNITLRLLLSDGSRHVLQTVADSTAEAIVAAQLAFGDRLRGASAQALRTPGTLIDTTTNPFATVTAANDSRYQGARA